VLTFFLWLLTFFSRRAERGTEICKAAANRWTGQPLPLTQPQYCSAIDLSHIGHIWLICLLVCLLRLCFLRFSDNIQTLIAQVREAKPEATEAQLLEHLGLPKNMDYIE
jgi:hypothetical protein